MQGEVTFNDILNWKGVYLVEYTCIPNDKDKNNNIKHCVVVDGNNKCVYDINYGCVKYQNLNLCNYYFYSATNIFIVYHNYRNSCSIGFGKIIIYIL